MKRTLYTTWIKDYLEKRGISEEQSEAISIDSARMLGFSIRKSIKQKLILDIVNLLKDKYKIIIHPKMDKFDVLVKSTGSFILSGRILNTKYLVCFKELNTPEQVEKQVLQVIRRIPPKDLLFSKEENDGRRLSKEILREERNKLVKEFTKFYKSLEAPKFGKESEGYIIAGGEKISFIKDDHSLVLKGAAYEYTFKRKFNASSYTQNSKKYLVAKATTRGGFLWSSIQNIDEKIKEI